jgi:hypothetical protein
VRIRCAPPGEVCSSPDQREDGLGERGHGTDSLSIASRDESCPCQTGHRRIRLQVAFTASAKSFQPRPAAGHRDVREGNLQARRPGQLSRTGRLLDG